ILVLCSGVVTTISKLTKTCVLRLTPDHLFFILPGKVTNGGVGMWCQLLQANFFQEYQMEGVTSEVQEICLEVSPEPWSRALKTVQSAKSVKLKLTRKHCACLTVAAELVSRTLNPTGTRQLSLPAPQEPNHLLALDSASDWQRFCDAAGQRLG
uniref:Checkpoint protein n=1 Tax=Poecilia mexicana TaxID=48701 RepID=A0A3B3XPP0_9TELE